MIMVEIKDTRARDLMQQILDNTPADLKKQLDYSFDLADRIDEQMKAKGVNNKQLAMLTGKRVSDVKRWLSGRHNFTLATIAKISVALEHDFLKIE